MVEYDKDYYNGRSYQDYWDFPSHEKRAQHLIDITRPYSVLDVGCAYGYIVKHLLDKGVEAEGCDISEYAGERAKEIIPGRFKLCDIRKGLPYGDKQFDVLYCEGVLEHIEEEHIPFIMEEFDRVAFTKYLQVSLNFHKDADIEEGHVCLKPLDWWIERVPARTYMAVHQSTDQNLIWMYIG